MNTNKITANRLRARGFDAYPFAGGVRVVLPGTSGAQVFVADNGYNGRVIFPNSAPHHFVGLSLPTLVALLDRY